MEYNIIIGIDQYIKVSDNIITNKIKLTQNE